eukprot:CAMPEP_0176003098 /NCGR_PEP_ID=MMETSP0120_2-20121206/994_1 /TAXON_ID=160619 /ORGANISM="Kryptoperidinium foliaceum, Strain CCMP 1326" /LENGTH=174 /DNA_ID=CAMNT_0017335721 /DNA_START=471 /DNA_END=992 /DNA_ORIENTATION=+
MAPRLSRPITPPVMGGFQQNNIPSQSSGGGDEDGAIGFAIGNEVEVVSRNSSYFGHGGVVSAFCKNGSTVSLYVDLRGHAPRKLLRVASLRKVLRTGSPRANVPTRGPNQNPPAADDVSISRDRSSNQNAPRITDVVFEERQSTATVTTIPTISDVPTTFSNTLGFKLLECYEI